MEKINKIRDPYWFTRRGTGKNNFFKSEYSINFNDMIHGAVHTYMHYVNLK